MSLLIVGSMAFDAIETPFGKTDKIVGGAATYIALSTSYFVNNTNVISVVGEDFPNSQLSLMKQKGIDVEGVQVKMGEKSFFWSGKYHNDMNSRDTLVTELNVLENFDPIVPESYQDAQYLMLGNLAPAVQIQVIERLKNRPKLVALDTMNFWMDIAREDLDKVIKKIDLLIINDEEARQLSEEYSLLKAAKKILKTGPKTLIIKKGEHGALLFHNDEIFYCPALPLEEVYDPTGAGDTFAGGLMGYIAKKDNTSIETLKGAIVYGSAMASFCVEKFGTAAIEKLTETEIQERADKFIKLTEVSI